MTVKTLQEHESISLRYFPKDYRRKSLERLAISFVSGHRVLDMRCLTGEMSVALAKLGHDVCSLDAFHESVECTNALAHSNNINQDIAQIWDLAGLVAKVGGKRFDTVICLDTLNHVIDDRLTVEEIAEVLRPDGRLILTAPAFPFLHGKRDERLGHLRRYTKTQLRGMLQRYGFEIELLRFWNMIAFPAYTISEYILRRGVSDPIRFAQEGPLGMIPCHLLTWWYMNIENRMLFPFGLTHFALARKRS
ncbi:MAG: class I SAM-dependent methyltransferase [Kiloniellales bacterium]|nr:class I SAM-dependent methyltransferase [Kiloniellales bacterium]